MTKTELYEYAQTMAFPQTVKLDEKTDFMISGMSIRFYAACAVIQGLSGFFEQYSKDEIIKHAFEFADSMIENERNHIDEKTLNYEKI